MHGNYRHHYLPPAAATSAQSSQLNSSPSKLRHNHQQQREMVDNFNGLPVVPTSNPNGSVATSNRSQDLPANYHSTSCQQQEPLLSQEFGGSSQAIGVHRFNGGSRHLIEQQQQSLPPPRPPRLGRGDSYCMLATSMAQDASSGAEQAANQRARQQSIHSSKQQQQQQFSHNNNNISSSGQQHQMLHSKQRDSQQRQRYQVDSNDDNEEEGEYHDDVDKQAATTLSDGHHQHHYHRQQQQQQQYHHHNHQEHYASQLRANQLQQRFQQTSQDGTATSGQTHQFAQNLMQPYQQQQQHYNQQQQHYNQQQQQARASASRPQPPLPELPPAATSSFVASAAAATTTTASVATARGLREDKPLHHVNFNRTNQATGADDDDDQGDSRKKKYLTAKYGQQQMNLIKKRLKIEMWLYEQLQELAKGSKSEAELDEIDVDLDQLLDMNDDDTRRRWLRKTLEPFEDLPSDRLDKFIKDVLEQSKLL